MSYAGLRERLHLGEPLLATFCILPRIEMVELVAAAGFDAVILDLEHGPLSVADLPHLVAAAKGAGLWTLARVPHLDASTIGPALDVGVDGVVVPMVASAKDAATAAHAARFAPEGGRGANPWVRAARYDGGADWFARANAEIAVIAMVEGSEGLAALDEIVAVPGIDAVFVGPVDLSQALGVPGQTDHPDVVASALRVVDRCRAHGLATGIFAPTPEAAARWRSLGLTLVVLGVDTGLVLDGLHRAVQHARVSAVLDARLASGG